jgi:preprotein translocase subunit SecB
MAQDPHQADPRAYNAVVGRTTLTNIRLTDAKFDLKAEALATDPGTWRREMKREPLAIVVENESGKIFGTLLFELICRHRRKRVFTCSARYLVSYRVEGGCDEDIGQLFVERVGPLNVYPYFRATVAHLAAQAGIPMPPLPIISLAPRSVKSAADFEEETQKTAKSTKRPSKKTSNRVDKVE